MNELIAFTTILFCIVVIVFALKVYRESPKLKKKNLND